jgi:hypothetical protein
VDGFGVTNLVAGESPSPRDREGHGTHVAAIAAGNYGVRATGTSSDFISGIAPRARLAAYKACWVDLHDLGECSDIDIVAAIDAAVADGVDVLNLSIGELPFTPIGPAELALLHASDAGVFVAAAAGNEGPFPGTINAPATAPWVTAVAASAMERADDKLADFSSRGPQWFSPDIAKPDMTAPGIGIVSATIPDPVRPEQPRGLRFKKSDGTSQATPQVAGAAALLMQLDEGRSPAAVKSALMTTADPHVVRQWDGALANPLEVGAGRIDPSRAADPGLVVEAGTEDYLRYLEGLDPALVPGELPTLAALDVNLPAVTAGVLMGHAATQRTFTSVDGTVGTWRASVEGLDGITTTATPEVFDIAPGASQTLQLDFTRNTAPFRTFTFGALVLTHTGDGRTVRLPVSVRPYRITIDPRISLESDQPSGQAVTEVTTGFQGDLWARGSAVLPPQWHDGKVTADPAAEPWRPSAAVSVHDFQVPAGIQAIAFDLAPVQEQPVDGDLDLFLYRDLEGDGFEADDHIASSLSPGAEESVQAPATVPLVAGSYRVSVQGVTTGSQPSAYRLAAWLIPDTDPNAPDVVGEARLRVTGDPDEVAPGDKVPLTLQWWGLEGEGPYLGVIAYRITETEDPSVPVIWSFVRINRRAASPGG